MRTSAEDLRKLLEQSLLSIQLSEQNSVLLCLLQKAHNGTYKVLCISPKFGLNYDRFDFPSLSAALGGFQERCESAWMTRDDLRLALGLSTRARLAVGAGSPPENDEVRWFVQKWETSLEKA